MFVRLGAGGSHKDVTGELTSNNLFFFGLRSIKDYYTRPGGKGHLVVSFLRGSMCADGMGCGSRWVRLVL